MEDIKQEEKWWLVTNKLKRRHNNERNKRLQNEAHLKEIVPIPREQLLEILLKNGVTL